MASAGTSPSQAAHEGVAAFISALNRGRRAVPVHTCEPAGPMFGPLNKDQTAIGMDLDLNDPQVMLLTATVNGMDNG